MPELPEVETVVRGIRPHLLNQRIVSALTFSDTVLGSSTVGGFTTLCGKIVQSVTRRGKYVVITLEDIALLVHLRMTGRLYVTASYTPLEADRWLRATITLENGQELRFSDSRRFGRVYLTHDVAIFTQHLGAEPLEESFTFSQFEACLAGRHRAIKPLLLDQSVIAGIGNIYADESLHHAHIHPLRLADSLTTPERHALYTWIRAVLQQGIAEEGASINWYRKPDGEKGNAQSHFYAYGRTGQPCKTCGTPIEKIRVAQRGTHYCPHCQPHA